MKKKATQTYYVIKEIRNLTGVNTLRLDEQIALKITYLPVYETKEEAEKHNQGNAPIWEITEDNG
jgi:hypothetical protein